MNRKELFNELYKFSSPEDAENTKKYSFEKAWSIIQIATEDREYEDNNVRVTMTRTIDEDIFTCEWKN